MGGGKTIQTERLLLRRFTRDDAPEIRRLCSDREVAMNTGSIDHPYPLNAEYEYLDKLEEGLAAGTSSCFAITERETGELMGSVIIWPVARDRRAEMGYKIGKGYWGEGYATEACRAMLGHGFLDLGLNKIHACHFTRNPASGRVLEKLGFVKEGYLRQHAEKWGEMLDMVMMSILRSEWDAIRQSGEDA